MLRFRDGRMQVRVYNKTGQARRQIADARSLSYTLGVTRTALSRVLNGHAAISPEMARRIEAWLGPERGGRAEIWLGKQMDYDLWMARQKPAPKVERAPERVIA